MGIAVKRTGAAEYGRYIKMLLCGAPGSGKTLLSSTFVNPFYASAEGGLMSIADRNIPYVEIRASGDLLAVKHAVDQDPKTREQILGFPVDTVVIDTIDEIQRILIRERLEEQKKETLQLQDWGWLGEQMAAIIRGFRNLPLNVVFTCHLKDTQDNESGRVWKEPGLSGAVAAQIPGAVDLALLLRTTTVTAVEDGQAVKRFVRLLQAQPDAHHSWIKDRSGKLPPEMEVDFDTDYKRLYAYIYGDLDISEQEQEAVSEVESLPEQPLTEQPATVGTIVEPEAVEDVLQATSTPEPVTVIDVPEPEKEVTVDAAPEAEQFFCEECGVQIDRDRADISKIRFRKFLCLEDFKAEGRKK